MSFHKYFSALCLASVMAGGCGVAPSSGDQDQVHKALRGDGWTNTNYNQLFGATMSNQTVTGLYLSGNQWYVSTSSSLTYAPVQGITYNGQSISAQSLTTSQGAFQVVGADSEDAAATLVLTVGGSLPGTLTITTESVDASGTFTRYAAEWISGGDDADGGAAPVSLCPRSVLDADGGVQTVSESLIPIGGARWSLDGSRTSDANAITLSCSHDAIGGCVTWGYGPWGTRTDEVTGKSVAMSSVHQACTRMKRDDICGTGSPVTTGFNPAFGSTTIHVRDRVGIHSDTNQTYATMEAFWDENGASCFNQSEYRSTDPMLLQRLAINIALCPNRAVACTANHSRVLLSARPCTATNASGDCVAN